MSYTFVLCGVSKATYDEIAQKLREAEYDHAFVRTDEGIALDMHGIALVIDKSASQPAGEEGDPKQGVLALKETGKENS
jgi:hypothetical protein